MENNKIPIYPVHPWHITEQKFTAEHNYRNETTFSLSNGYLGTRGTLEEAYDCSVEEGLEGNFINGFYESEQIRYGEWNFGFPTESQSLLNLPNCKRVELLVDGEKLNLLQGKIEEYSRILDMEQGILRRSLLWTTRKGSRIKIEISRLVSLRLKNLMEIRYQVTPLNFSGNITWISGLDADVENHTRKTNPLVDYGPFGRHLIPDRLTAESGNIYFEGTAINSGLTMACGCSHTIRSAADTAAAGFQQADRMSADGLHAETVFQVKVEEGLPVILEKQIIYTSSLDMERNKLYPFVTEQLAAAKDGGWEKEALSQQSLVGNFWKHGDVVIRGNDSLLQGIRFNLFHIMQSASRDGKNGMGAKGLSGEGYEGHYFWDTEMYVMPVLIYTDPALARSLLEYRYRTLDAARERARILGHDTGALYPWRTINGKEASTYFPLGTAQYHINGDIAYAFKLYVDVTGDMEFLERQAAEVLIETARVWADVGCFAECRGGKYCICAVTGPDEYNAIVDNNFYTNLMARENLRAAVWAVKMLQERLGFDFAAFADKLGIQKEEPDLWERIADNMYFPYDEKLQVYPQDDGFLMRKPWDESRIPPEKRHLLYENYHPLFIFRQRMSKQADAILGMYLYSQYFTKEELKRNYDFYQGVTLHHSSLSTCIFGILASRIGYHKEAYDYFLQSARMDLDDYHDNFYAGIHAANMAGTWQAVVNGFGGLHAGRGCLEFHPVLPGEMTGYEFHINYRGNLLRVTVDRENTVVTLVEGSNAVFVLSGNERILTKEGDYVTKQTESNFF